MRRFALFRVTALPTERLALTPNLEFVIPLGDAIRMASGWAYDFPVRRTRLKSVELVSRFLRFISPNLVTSQTQIHTGKCQPVVPRALSVPHLTFQFIFFTWLFMRTAKRWRPFRRRLLITALPPRVFIRARNPCTRRRRRIFGW